MKLTRRQFLRRGALGAATTWFIGRPGFASASPNARLNLGVIGVAGRGGDNLQEVSSENIVALCDVDLNNLKAAAQKFKAARTFYDFRDLLEVPDLDAVVISTPDHTHAVIAAAALRRGLHVYCEKPLTRTVSEARAVTELARKHRRVTQIGTQIHAGNNYRRVVELVQSYVIGPVQEVHVWVNATYGGQDWPRQFPPPPRHLRYDAWLGPVPYVPYSPEWVPFKWRNWWAFGGGALADFGCHYMDLPFWALDLRYPELIEVIDGPPVHPDSTPPWLIVRYEFPATARRPAVRLLWYHGGKQPVELPADKREGWKSGVLFMGTEGMLLADYGRHVLLPESKFQNHVPPLPFIPDSVGHHREWILACKTGGPTTCSFDYSGPLTEAALLGNVAYRARCSLQWDARRLLATNCPRAAQFIHHRYRDGWSL